VATADIGIQKYKADDPNYANNKQLYDAWDIFYTTSMLADVGAGVTQLGIALKDINIVKTWNNFNDLITKTQNIPEQFTNAWNAVRGVKSVEETFNIGDEIAGIKIVNVRAGTNGQIAIIGKNMESVKQVADELIKQGKNVIILDDNYLKGMTFHLDAYDAVFSDGTKAHYSAKDWTVKEALLDMSDINNYKGIKDVNGYITIYEDIVQIPMYKIDEQWMNIIKNNGYDVLDIGNPLNTSNTSFFYNLEKIIMNWK
jgi:hypothetical protein